LDVFGSFEVLHDVLVNGSIPCDRYSRRQHESRLHLLSIIELRQFHSWSRLDVLRGHLLLGRCIGVDCLGGFYRFLFALGGSLGFDHLVVGAAVEKILLLVGVFLLKLLLDLYLRDVLTQSFCCHFNSHTLVGGLSPDELGEPVAFLGAHVDLLPCEWVHHWLHHSLLVDHVVGIRRNHLPKIAQSFMIARAQRIHSAILLVELPLSQLGHDHEVGADTSFKEFSRFIT
jgi:hypothetical protein